MSLEKLIGYEFRDKSLLNEALMHPSVNRDQKVKKNYQRLEFLGDKVLGLCIADWLIRHFEGMTEGEISRRHAFLVSGETCVKIAGELNLSSFIIMSRGEEKNHGRTNHSILENVLEAIIGAIYLDAGIEYAEKFVLEKWESYLNNIYTTPINPVADLQEICQKKYKILPIYTVMEIKETEPKVFEACVEVPNTPKFSGQGLNHKLAKKQAAQNMLNYLLNSV